MPPTEDALAVAMLRDQFGKVVAQTAHILLLHPASTLVQIIQHAKQFYEGLELGATQTEKDKIRIRLARDALAVLVQHDIAFTEDKIALGTAKNRVKGERYLVYFLRTSYALFRVRVPLYLGFVRQTYGDVGGEAVLALFQRGRLTAKQILSAVMEKMTTVLDISVQDGEVCLSDMATSGLIRHVGMRSNVKEQENGNDSEDDDEPVQQVGKKRSRSPGHGKENGDRQVITVRKAQGSITIRAPTRHNDNDLWTVCYWHLNREFRNRCCCMVAFDHLTGFELASRIFQAGMKIASEREDCENPAHDFETKEVDTVHIKEHLSDQDGNPFSESEFWDALQVLLQKSPAFVLGNPRDSPSHLTFVPGRLVSEARQKTLDDFVTTRYGPIGKRVFRALVIDGGMEEKTLALKCLLHVKVVREHLFRMYKDRMVVMQEVPRSNDQTRASNWYYLWKVNAMSVFRNMNEITYKTTLNLFLRLESMEKSKGTSAEEDQKLQRQRELLRLSIIRMDQSTMVLRDFGPITSIYMPTKYAVMDGVLGKAKKKR